MPIHVDDLLIALNLKAAIWQVKSNLAAHFKIQDQGPVKAILGIKVMHDQTAWTMVLYQPGYIQSILDNFSMANCNLVSILMEQNVRLSKTMCLETPEEKLTWQRYPTVNSLGSFCTLWWLLAPTFPML